MNNKIKYIILIGAVLIIVLALGIYYFTIYNNETQMNMNSINSNNYSSYFYLNPISTNDIASYKSSCTHIPLNDMFSSPDSYKGQKIVETGQIVNISVNDEGVTEMLLDTPETDRNFTRLFVTYKGETSFVPGDNIAAYGQVDTFTVYDIEQPFLKAVYIEKT